MAVSPVKLGQQPSPNAGPEPYPSSTSTTSQSSLNQIRSASNCSSSSITKSPSSSLLTEEQLAKLPPIFREKTHQQCIEMDGNIFVPPNRGGGRDQFMVVALHEGIRLLPSVLKNFLFSIAYVIAFLAVSSLVLGSLLLVLGLFFGVPVYLVIRHYALVSLRQSRQKENPNPVLGPSFMMFIMGSGGHTTEIISMIEHSMRPAPGTFRRYIVNEDDGMTRQRVIDLEQRIGDRFFQKGQDPGLFDIQEVKRARYVHQSWLTTPITVVQSLISIGQVVLFENPALVVEGRPDWRFPQVVVTNGPGTGFLVLAVIHVFKMLKFVSTDYMRSVYVESFAKVESLSLTGLLVHYTNVADLFLVQHAALAKRYGRMLVENFVVRPAEAAVPHEEEEE